MQIIVPLAGKSPFFPSEHFFFPKSLVEVRGRPMIEWVVENLKSIHPELHFIFVVHQEEVARFSLDRTLQLLTNGGCDIIALRQPTRGALCSALLAVDYLNLNDPLILANGDQIIEAHLPSVIESFHAMDASAGVVTFDSVHPRWSYVSLDDEGAVVQAAEKSVISRYAIAGFYYFRTGAQFVRAAMRSIENKSEVQGEFYIAPCLNEIILEGGKVCRYQILDREYVSFYSPDRINHFESMDHSRPQKESTKVNVVQVVIPAGGLGSRFVNAGYAKPKPFIDVLGQPMIERVIRNVAPNDSRVHLLLRSEHIRDEMLAIKAFVERDYTIHQVENTTEGTACTLLLARECIDSSLPLLVANSDQLVDFDVNDFVRDCLDRNLDGSILVFRDSTKNPKWSFARVAENGLVTEVAEKVPISDLATVGIYFFRRGADFVASAVDMIARNDRVNNEFYTCPVYNYMIAKGLKIGVYEVAESSMHGLGTPEDLESFLKGHLGREGEVR